MMNPIIFCPPPLGKPDPTIEKPPTGPDTRPRIRQPGAKNSTCWLYAFNLIRERYNAPNTQDLTQRFFEKQVSLRRKGMTQLENSLPEIVKHMNNPRFIALLTGLTKQLIQQLLLDRRTLDQTPNGLKEFHPFFKPFVKQNKTENLYDFFVDYLMDGKTTVNNDFLEKIGKLDLANDFLKNNVNPSISADLKRNLLDNMAKIAAGALLGLKQSDWHPGQPFEGLIKALQEGGPLTVEGSFGLPHYNAPPRKLTKTVAGREIFFWDKNDPKIMGTVLSHMVLIVGAEKNQEREFVYYIDPCDESDPAHPEKQRIFLMSYDKLINGQICDLYGYVTNSSSRGYSFQAKVKPEPANAFSRK